MKNVIIAMVVVGVMAGGILLQRQIAGTAERPAYDGMDNYIREHGIATGERLREARALEAECEFRDGAIYLRVHNPTDYDFADVKVGVFMETAYGSDSHIFQISRLESWDTIDMSSRKDNTAMTASVVSILGDRQ